MKKTEVYISSKEEVQEILQNLLDDRTLELVPAESVRTGNTFCFFEGRADSFDMSGAEIDNRLAQHLGVKMCVHYIDYGIVYIVVLK